MEWGEERRRGDGRKGHSREFHFVAGTDHENEARAVVVVVVDATLHPGRPIYLTREGRGSGCFHRCRELLCHYAMSGTGHDDIFFQWR